MQAAIRPRLEAGALVSLSTSPTTMGRTVEVDKACARVRWFHDGSLQVVFVQHLSRIDSDPASRRKRQPDPRKLLPFHFGSSTCRCCGMKAHWLLCDECMTTFNSLSHDTSPSQRVMYRANRIGQVRQQPPPQAAIVPKLSDMAAMLFAIVRTEHWIMSDECGDQLCFNADTRTPVMVPTHVFWESMLSRDAC